MCDGLVVVGRAIQPLRVLGTGEVSAQLPPTTVQSASHQPSLQLQLESVTQSMAEVFGSGVLTTFHFERQIIKEGATDKGDN